jgi:methylenetetrahydrofolate--tRNA-(uracil-5-)-methyltransferase
LGVIHRNTYVNAPQCLTPTLELKNRPGVFLAGQLTGVEGYVESAAIGILVGRLAAARAQGRTMTAPPRATAYGCLMSHLQDETERDFAPMNMNWGLLPELPEKVRDKGVRRAQQLCASREAFASWLTEN